MKCFLFTLTYLISIYFAQSCEKTINVTSVNDCDNSSTNKTLCCLAENTISKSKQCIPIEENSFINKNSQIVKLNNMEYNVVCPILTEERKCNFYKKPTNYLTCAEFSRNDSLCCLAKLNNPNQDLFCYWETKFETTYGKDTIFYQNYTVDTYWAIQNNITILKVNAFDSLVNISGIKTCYGVADANQTNCSKISPNNSTSCALANTNKNLCCLIKVTNSSDNNSNTKCMWNPDTSKLCNSYTVIFNYTNYTVDCTFSFSKYLTAIWISLFFIFLF